MKKILTILLVLAAAAVLSAVPVHAQRKADEPQIDFQHRYMTDMHLKMGLSKLKTFNKLLPNSLRREIGDEYYPAIRRQLKTADKCQFKEGEAEVERLSDGKVKLKLIFPNFYMTISNVTWEQLDVIFSEYF
ncbi:MAG: hypothetical protein J6X82_01225 [Bacteroidales bacterium]|nr:hypothetical protein [Bacteroidales bacterium]